MLKQCIVFCMRDKSWSIILIRATLPMLSRRRIGARAKGREKKKKNNGSSLPYDGSSRELGFVPCQRSVATFHKNKKQKKKRERKKTKNNEKEEKKKKQQRYSNCMLRAACDCVSVILFFFLFFFWKGRQNEHFCDGIINKFRIERPGQFSAIIFFLLFIFVLFILFNYRIVRFAIRVR